MAGPIEASTSRISLSLHIPPPGVCYPGQALRPVVRFKGDTKYEKLSLRLRAETPVRVWGKDRWVSRRRHSPQSHLRTRALALP